MSGTGTIKDISVPEDVGGMPASAIWSYCNSSAMRRAARHLGQLYDDAMGETGLKGTQYSLLSQIRLSGAPTLKALAGEMVMDLSALGHTLKPLIRDGLVELVPSETDRRVKHVRLTAEGAARQQELTQRWQVAQARFDAALGPERARELRGLLGFLGSEDFAKAFRAAEDAGGP